ncbi:MAG: DNA-3-methyladenine glycosylase [Acidobacteria bacterium]|nr:DNA-3-methyladenine glycosylase [Acidobacteriota bacterium]
MRRAIHHLKGADPIMAGLIDRVGNGRMAVRPPTFETLARAIVFQQLNWKAAIKIYERLLEAAGGEVTPDSILKLTPQRMRKCGLSRQKLSYIRDLAKKTRSGEVNFTSLPAQSDEEVIAHLTRVKGIGVWSAQMFLMFALKRRDVLPTTDYGILSAVRKAYGIKRLPKARTVARLAEKWRPYRSVACWYLWRSLDVRT